MAKPPRLECPEQGGKFAGDRAQFLLVIKISVWPVIGDGIVVLSNVSQHPQQEFTIFTVGLLERTFLDSFEQRNDGPAVLFDEAVTQFIHGQSWQV